MSEPAKEKWVELCEKAGHEHDSDRLLELVRQINDLVERAKPTKTAPVTHPAR